MSDDSKANAESNATARERLSAMLDGELDATPTAQACAHWRESDDAKAAWHAYHLIGDVMRSDDLASDPAHDAGFLEAFRARLASEPVVLAPRPLESVAPALVATARARAAGVPGRRWSWMAPTAVAAGFVAVAGVLTLTRGPGVSADGPTGTSVAMTSPAPASASFVAAAARPSISETSAVVEPQTPVATGQVIRDARLDRYLAAHKQFAGSSALGVPSAYLRNATVEAPGR